MNLLLLFVNHGILPSATRHATGQIIAAESSHRLKLYGYFCCNFQPNYNVGATSNARLRLGPQGLHLGQQRRLGRHLHKTTY